MKKFIWMGLIGLAVVAVVAFAGVAYVNAQAPTPGTPGGRGYGMGGGWMMGGSQPMYEYMHEALAEKLGLTEQEFEDQLAQGKTAWQIADEKGIAQDAFVQIMTDARSEALDKMVADGVITAEQADWMKTRGGAMMGGNGRYGAGSGGCPMFNGGTGSNGTAPGGFGRGRGGRGMMGGNY